MKQVLQLSHYRRRQRPGPAHGPSYSGRLRKVDSLQWLQERDILHAELEMRNEALQAAWLEVERQGTELRQARAELQRAQTETQAVMKRCSDFYDCAPVAYFTLTPSGTICDLNRYGIQLLGAERHQLVDRRFGLFVEPRDRGIFNDFLAGVFAGGKECCTVALLCPDNHGHSVVAHLEAVRRESGLTCSVVAIDMTERQRAEAALEKYRAELEATVKQRTADLLAVNQELEGFVYAASHDMKAPLARLSSLSAVLGRQFRSQLEGDGLTLLDLIQQNALRLSALVDDLLAHAQIGQQPLNVRALDIKSVVQAALEEVADEIRQKGADVRLDLPENLSVEADPFSLGQILRNLIENALKYSAHATPPVVEIGARVANEHCRLWVRDNGIGISRVHHERIFEIFRRLHTYGEYPGTGVGLALVKKAIERMGGQVWVESEPGQGATFCLEWPL